MVEVKKLKEMSPERLEKVQAVIDTLNLLGIADDEIMLLPQVLANWPKVVANLNAMAQDLSTLKMSSIAKSQQDKSTDTDDNIRASFGFGDNTELTQFDGGGRKQ